eukprot:gnl/TRDRNA2_/TRDRNA2_162392_c0_seq2.p1 gnl/TRDRNA2_/TRDRNA2_162392_c0~~gnl/TRDRNA2_/TRDRNA2_162392_c0_seq2.p1  ORF type:complete len:249 (-),score=65.01 gnl/TRDRNA2_/TRDRNA2_162392_c0_seq2:71-817(-)
MLFCMLYIFGIIFLQAASGVLLDDVDTGSLSEQEKEDLRDTWGSVSGAMITLYMAITGGNDWADLAEPLKHAGLHYYGLFLFYIAFLTFAVLNVLTGIFVDAAMLCADDDRGDVTTHDEMSECQKNVYKVCNLMGFEPGSMISFMEFTRIIEKPEMIAYLDWLEITEEEVERLFLQLSNNNESLVDIDHFIDGCGKVKGTAKSIDMQTMLYSQRSAHKMLKKVAHMCERQMCQTDVLLRSIRGQRQPP